MKFLGKAVTWDGYVIRVNLNDDDPLSKAYHSANILIKMENSDFNENTGADIGISISQMNVEKHAEIIENLQIGDHIRFNATIISQGDRNHLHHLRAFGIERMDGKKDLHAFFHKSGRYKLKLADDFNHTFKVDESHEKESKS